MKTVMTFLLAVSFALLTSGCETFYPPITPGAALNSGKILVVGRVVFQPSIDQKEFRTIHVGENSPRQGEVRFLMSPNADEPVKKDSVIPFSPRGLTSMNLSFEGFSAVEMEPGTRYVRWGVVTLSEESKMIMTPGSTVVRSEPVFNDLYLYGDLEVALPPDARAVYIGNLVYHHDGTASSKVSVHDDYKNAAKYLDSLNIPGVSSKNMVKRLASVVRDN